MAAARTVWGIDIGQCALKALKLSSLEGEVQVETFDIIEHPKILSQPDADRDQLIRNAMEQFLARNDVTNSTVVVSVPGQASFMRMVKLPPVEPKKIPDIVRFEAEQQIPFPIGDVVWRWQTFQDADSPDVELGLFAMKRSDVDAMLRHYEEVGVKVDVVQMAPLALYNFLLYDGQTAEDGATILADVGAEKTDLVIADGGKIWARSIQIGGNNFTEALVRTFKLSFAKAEKLKRTAATSKYARQIFQAMRPVFSDLVQELQRSIGSYSQTHRETRFRKLLGLGNGFRLPGLQKFLEQNLNLPVHRLDAYNRLQSSPAINAPVFTENVLSFAVAYGLGVQGLAEGTIETNLLPEEIQQQVLWSRKRWWFAGAAACLLAALGMRAWRIYANADELAPTPALEEARQVDTRLGQFQRQFSELGNQGQSEAQEKEKYLQLLNGRDLVPQVQDLILRSIAQAARDQRNLENRKDWEIYSKTTPREQQIVLLVDSLDSVYAPDLTRATVAPGTGEGSTGETGTTTRAAGPAGFLVTLTGRTPLPRQVAMRLLLNNIQRASQTLVQEKEDLELLEFPQVEMLELSPTAGGAGMGATPPATGWDTGMPAGTPGEPKVEPYTPVRVTWKVVVKSQAAAQQQTNTDLPFMP